MDTKLDPYEFSKVLRNLSIDVSNGDAELTVSELSSTLASAAEVVLHLADSANHYRLRSSIVVVVNGEEIEMPDDVVEHFYKEVAHSWVTEAFRSYLGNRAQQVSGGF